MITVLKCFQPLILRNTKSDVTCNKALFAKNNLALRLGALILSLKHHHMQKLVKIFHVFVFLIGLSSLAFAQNKADSKKDKKSAIYKGLEFRSIGPAFMSGRISDIVIHPDNENVWYVTAGSGGVWKTENSGTTWKSILQHKLTGMFSSI